MERELTLSELVEELLAAERIAGPDARIRVNNNDKVTGVISVSAKKEPDPGFVNIGVHRPW